MRRSFGHFALEFDISTLKRLGAMPVFYIPQSADPDTNEVTSLGSTLVVQSIDAMILAMRLAGVKKVLTNRRSGSVWIALSDLRK